MLCEEGVAAIIRGDLQPSPQPTSSSSSSPSSVLAVEDLLPEDPYLCSGFHLYLECEPDLMSSMSLVHSRIGRVYFRRRVPSTGALVSTIQMHSLPALNHHFRVFEVLDEEPTSL